MELKVQLPDSLRSVWLAPLKQVAYRFYSPSANPDLPTSLASALRALQSSVQQVPAGLVPITYVDDRSLACVVCVPEGGKPHGVPGHVVRWHLDDIPTDRQAVALDTDARSYLTSIEVDTKSYRAGYDGVMQAASEYEARLAADPGFRPKPEDLRPFQLACQNVIVGLAALRHEPAINALIAKYWMTCEATHVATNEANRALSALMLCDAFQAGGTMEINFEQHPERTVPAVLARYGRSLGLTLGEELQGSISPGEARQLFLAVTPMPPDLRSRVDTLIATGTVSTERVCFSLLSPVWRAMELDFLLACSGRVDSILRGGAELHDRAARLPELEACRAALLAGMFFRRLDSVDGAAGSPADGAKVRIFDDTSHGVQWRVLDAYAAVEFTNVPRGALPWQTDGEPVRAPAGRLIVLPRAHPHAGDANTARELASEVGPDVPIAFLTPLGVPTPTLDGVPVLVGPDEASALNAQIERNFTTSRLARV